MWKKALKKKKKAVCYALSEIPPDLVKYSTARCCTGFLCSSGKAPQIRLVITSLLVIGALPSTAHTCGFCRGLESM